MEFTRANLEPAENLMVEALEAGTVFGPATEDKAAWPLIRAGVVRNLLRGVYPDLIPDPRGLRLHHVRIEGRLELDHLETTIPLDLDRCELLEGLSAIQARLSVLQLRQLTINRAAADEAILNLSGLHLAHLGLAETILINSKGPALCADGLAVESSAWLNEGFTATGCGEMGAVRLLGASVGGQLYMDGATLTNEAGPALIADGLVVESSAWLNEGFTASGYAPDGAVRLLGATVGGQLHMSGATLINEAGPALHAESLVVGSSVWLNERFTATGRGEVGAVRLLGACIRGQLSLQGAQIINESGPALYADKLTVKSIAWLNEGFTATGHEELGTVRLIGATIGGRLHLNGATLINEAGPALYADWLTIEADAYFDGLTATGHGDRGAVQLGGATIVGHLYLNGATLINEAGPALFADRLTIEADAYLDEGFTATGHGDSGAILLGGATIVGDLYLSGATLINATGPALYANGLTVGSGAYLDEGFTASGYGELGTVRLLGATVGGQLDMSSTTLINEAGPTLAADAITVGSDVYLDEGFTVTGDGPVGTIQLTRAVIGGNLNILDAHFPAADGENGYPTVVLSGTRVGSDIFIASKVLQREIEAGSWDIDGLTYRTLETDPGEWLDFLREGTRNYSPQPYQQFAAVARAQGDERLTQKILIAQNNDLLIRSRKQHGLLTGRQRAGLWLLRLTVGYGYRTWRSLGWLTAFVAIAIATTLTVGVSSTTTLQHPPDPRTGGPVGPCSIVDLVTLGLGTIPLVPLVPVANNECIITDTPLGLSFLVASITLKVFAWAMLTLFVAGYTNIVRKPGP